MYVRLNFILFGMEIASHLVFIWLLIAADLAYSMFSDVLCIHFFSTWCLCWALIVTIPGSPMFTFYNFATIYFQCMLRYIFEKATLQQIKLSDEETQAVKVVGDNLLEEYITAKTTANYLFPQDRVIINFVPYKLIASNVSLMNYFEAFT